MVENSTVTPLAQRLAQLKAEKPHAYPRDYAALLGVSEAELTPIYYPGRVRELNHLSEALAALSGFSQVKLMARTSFAVLEIFSPVSFEENEGFLLCRRDNLLVVLNPGGIGKVYYLAAEKEQENAALLIFDKMGVAALKLYFPPEAWDGSVAAGTASPHSQPAQRTEDFFLTQRSGYAPEDFVELAETIAPRQFIEEAAGLAQALGFSISNAAMGIFIRHVPQRAIEARGWFNILDHNFNLHLKEDAISHCLAARAKNWMRLELANSAGEKITLYREGKK
ncbi:MAG: hypothetical protein N2Z22_06535 [Turneriella sp.]|nr:hypothetical protein [Turneriella sp.]